MNEQSEYISEEMTGFKARVFQHMIDHIWDLDLLNYAVANGRYKIEGFKGHSELNETVETYEKQVRERQARVTERLATDERYQKKASAEDSVRTFYVRQVLDPEFEEEMHEAFIKAYIADMKKMQKPKELPAKAKELASSKFKETPSSMLRDIPIPKTKPLPKSKPPKFPPYS